MSSKEDEEVKNRVTELIRYCADGNLDIVRCYVDPNTVNCVDNEGRTPLYAAACSGNVELCSFLLSSKANANQQTGHDFYPIHGASSHGHDSVLSLLLKHSTGINVQDSNGDTALHLACCRGNEECVNILLDAGSALEIKNNMGKSPAMEAASNSHFNIMQVLKDFDHSKFTRKRSISPNHAILQESVPPHISLPIFSPVETEGNTLEECIQNFKTPESDIRLIPYNRPSSEQGYHKSSSLRTYSYCSCKLIDVSPQNNYPSTRRDTTLSGLSTDSALDFRSNLDKSRMSECVIKHMLESFQPSPDSLLRFRLCMVKELVQRQASHKNIAKEFFVMLHTLKNNASPEVIELIDKIYRDFRIDSIFDLYTNYNVGNGMRVNIDFSIDPIKDCLFIKDPISCKVELISLDAIGVGNFNIKIALLASEYGEFYDPATERVKNEMLLKYLSKYDPAYQILFHPYILQPSHIYCASIEDYLPYLKNKEFQSLQLPASAFFILSPILDVSLYQFFHSKSENQADFDPSQDLTILSLLTDCLLALEHLRQHGVVHRNISPQNIIVDIKHKCALLSNFSSSIQLCNFQGDPYHVRDINNSIPLYCNVSYAPELSHFSSLPQDQLSELELRLVYAHVDAYSVGRSFYQNIFLRKTEPFPLQKYCEDDPFCFVPSSITRDFLQRILLNLVSSSPKNRPSPLSTAKSILCLLSLEEYILKEPTHVLLTSLLASYFTENRQLTPSSLYFFMLCGQEDVIVAQNYYFNK